MNINPGNYWPLGSTIQKSFQIPQPNHPYYLKYGYISVNPTNGLTVLVYRKGNLDSGDSGTIFMNISKDGGANFQQEQIIYGPITNFDCRNIAGGYDSNGVLYVFFAKWDLIHSNYTSINYLYSPDDGNTWSIDYILPNLNNTTFSPYGHIIDVGINNLGCNTLYQTWYGDDSTNYSLYLYKSIDSGVSFTLTNIITIYQSTNNICIEPSMVNVGGGCFLVLARIVGGTSFYQFKSEDNCNTWGV